MSSMPLTLPHWGYSPRRMLRGEQGCSWAGPRLCRLLHRGAPALLYLHVLGAARAALSLQESQRRPSWQLLQALRR